MRDEYGFLCVGQAAGNIGSLFEEKGYNVLYLNTSTEDLDLLKNSNHKYHIEGGEGCAKDRDRAKSLLANDEEAIINTVKEKLPQKLIFIVFASGGGTGSGLSPYLADMLLEEFNDDEFEPSKRFAAITILPSDAEPLQPAINCYNCCRELLDVEGLGSVFFLDNNTRDDKMKINQEFVNGLDKILSIPETHKSTKGNVDKAELKKVLFETAGMATFAVKGRECSNSPALISAMHKSVFAPIDNSGTVLYYVFSTTQEIDKTAVITEFGEPLDTFTTYNEKDNIILMTGMQPPFERLDKVSTRVKAKSDKVSASLDNALDNKLGGEIGIIKKPRKKNTVVKEKIDQETGVKTKVTERRLSAREMLKQYRR